MPNRYQRKAVLTRAHLSREPELARDLGAYESCAAAFDAVGVCRPFDPIKIPRLEYPAAPEWGRQTPVALLSDGKNTIIKKKELQKS